MPEKRKIIIFMSLGILVALFLIFISWRYGSESPASTEQVISNDKLSTPATTPSYDYSSKYITIRQISPGTAPIGDPDEQNTKAQPGPGTMNGPPQPQQPQGTSQEGPQSLTKEEVFNRLWPPVYREALQSLETRMLEDKFITTEEKHEVIASDEDVYSILSKLIGYMESRGWINTDDAAKLREGLTVYLPKQVEAERKNLEANGISTSIVLPRDQHLTKSYSDEQTVAQDIIDGLKYVFTVPTAEAQLPGVSGWHTAPDCYKDLAPFNPVPGFNSLGFCCNCGLLCLPTGCVFMDDCGPFSALCTVPLGCLNLNCAAWQNAIWDGPPGATPPMTFTCGCG